MSQLVVIEVFRCDMPGCDAIAGLHTDEDVASFVANWATSAEIDYCPRHRDATAGRAGASDPGC